MPKARQLFWPALFLCGACERTPPAVPRPEPPADPVDAQTRLCFTGDVVLRDQLERETRGAIVLSVRPIGGRTAYLQRSYEILDPWRTGNSIAFGLSPRDGVVDPLPTFGREMELVVRFDADGNPATDEAGDVEVVTRARTGAVDLAIEIARTGPDHPRAAEVDGQKVLGQQVNGQKVDGR